MESGSGNELVKAKIDLVAAGHFLQKRDYQRYGEKAIARKFVHN